MFLCYTIYIHMTPHVYLTVNCLTAYDNKRYYSVRSLPHGCFVGRVDSMFIPQWRVCKQMSNLSLA